MLEVEKIEKKVRVKNRENEKYPDIGCVTIVTSKSGKSKMLHLNNKALEMLNLSWTDNSLTRIAVIRGYDGYDIIIGSTDLETVSNTVNDGTYKTGNVNFKTHNVQSTKMSDIIIEHFNLTIDKGDNDKYNDVEVFLTNQVSEGVYELSLDMPSSDIEEVSLDNGEDVKIDLGFAETQVND